MGLRNMFLGYCINCPCFAFWLFVHIKNIFIKVYIILKAYGTFCHQKITILVFCANFYVLIWIWILFDVSLTKTVCNLCFIESYGCFCVITSWWWWPLMTTGDDHNWLRAAAFSGGCLKKTSVQKLLIENVIQ